MYSAIGGDTNYDGWRVLDATKTEVDFSLIVHHRKGTNVGDWIFQGTMLKVNGRWLMNGLYTAAINNPVRGSQHEVGPADFAAAGTGGEPPRPTRRSAAPGFAALFVAMGLVFVVMATIGIVVFLRGRKAHHRAESAGLSSLPPLPSRSANP